MVAPGATVTGALLPFSLTVDTTGAATAVEGITNSAKEMTVEKTELTTSGTRKLFRITYRWILTISHLSLGMLLQIGPVIRQAMSVAIFTECLSSHDIIGKDSSTHDVGPRTKRMDLPF